MGVLNLVSAIFGLGTKYKLLQVRLSAVITRGTVKAIHHSIHIFNWCHPSLLGAIAVKIYREFAMLFSVYKLSP